MKYLKAVVTTILLALSTSVSAITYTYGNLTSDDSTNFIKDTVTGREYLRFDTFDLSYADTLAAVDTGGIYDDWSIATSDTADDFYAAILGVGSTPCSGATAYGTLCGTVLGWSKGDFGNSYSNVVSLDYFWYLSTNSTANRSAREVGLAQFLANGQVSDHDDDRTGTQTDTLSGGYAINALLYRDTVIPSTVPVPAAAWLFGSALLGFFGFSRRKANA